MTPELERRLAADFPHFFGAVAKREHYTLEETLFADFRNMPLAQAFGIETGDGWYGLIRRLAERLEPWCEATGAYAVQIKEKYATLRVYMSEPDGTEQPVAMRRERGPLMSVSFRASSEDAAGAIDEAEEESARTCEDCGAPGTEREHGGWYSTRCDDCDDPARRFIARTESIERLLRYVIKPKTDEEARAWRLALGNVRE